MGVARTAPDRVDEDEAVHARHLEIAQHEVEARLILLEDFPSFFAVLRRHDLAAGLGKLGEGELAHDRVVVDREHPQRLIENVLIPGLGSREQHTSGAPGPGEQTMKV
jgi:hypothetical protein